MLACCRRSRKLLLPPLKILAATRATEARDHALLAGVAVEWTVSVSGSASPTVIFRAPDVADGVRRGRLSTPGAHGHTLLLPPAQGSRCLVCR